MTRIPLNGDALPRFWCRSRDAYTLDAGGYLADPRATRWGSANPWAVSTAALAQHRALVLLGEPGIGKTTVLNGHRPLLPPSGDVVAVVDKDLATYASEDRLIREIFDCPAIRDWRAGNTELCLVLDSVDELVARLPTFPALFADYLRQWPTQRLVIRLACRTAEWPRQLNDVLRERYDADLNLVELLPLRRPDVAALVADIVDPDEFLAEVERCGAVPFAVRPLTGRMLAREFARTGGLPRRAADIYRAALLAMCEQADQPSGAAGSPSARLAIARRIAAITVFGTHPAVWLGRLADHEPPDASVDDCCGDTEPADGAHVPVTEQAVRATLSTALFTGRGEHRLGWAHATFADYLSAQWLIANQLTRSQVRSLLLAPDGQVYPQVRATAAWAVSIDPAEMGWLVRCDPEAFVGKVDVPNAQLRAEVVEGLMDRAAAGVWRRDWGTTYRNLAHPGIAEQVRDALASESDQVRRLAIDLATHCGLDAVRPDLVAIALDPGRHRYERNAAALAALHIAEDAPTGDLVPLVTEPAIRGEDPDDELLGAGLLACWPHAISTAAALAHIRAPQRRNLYGNYASFIARLADALTLADLPDALGWLRRIGPDTDAHHVAPLTNATLRLALDHLDDPQTLEAVAEHARTRAVAYQPLFADDFRVDTDLAIPDAARRRLALTLLADPADDVLFGIIGHGSGLGLLTDEDFLWLVDAYANADTTTRRALARVAGWLFRIDDREHVDAVLSLPTDHPLRRDVTGAWTEPVALDSPQAAAARQQWQETRTLRRRPTSEHTPPVDDWIVQHLDAVEAGETARFWQAARLVTVPPSSARYHHEHEPDLTAHPRWPSLPGSVQRRFLSAAWQYVLNGNCDPERWLGEDLRYFPAEAGYRALILILRDDPEALAGLPAAAWQQWAPILVAWTCTVNGASWDDKRVLLQHALPHAGSELRAALAQVIRAAERTGTHMFAREEAALLWDDEVAARVLATVQHGTPEPPRTDLLQLLAEHAPGLVRPLLHRWLSTDGIDQDRDAAATALRLLLATDARESWPLIRQRLNDRPEFVAEALLDSADVATRQVPDLAEGDLAELYQWLQEQFPPATDPDHDEVHWVGPRESIGNWRDAILNRLENAGTDAAVDALRWLADTAPQHHWLRRVVAAAQDRARTARWSPIRPHELRRLATQHQTRLVQSSRDLLELTVDALAAVQQRLQGQTPDAHLLWDTRVRRPKRENEISNYLRNQLDDRLRGRAAAVNREVEVRAASPTGIGERTDLHITAAATDRSGGDVLRAATVVGEVKGSWNDDVVTALRTQLVDRYMADVGTRHGIYIVAWFDPEWWDRTDHARARAARWPGPTDLQLELDAAAAEVRRAGAEVVCVVLDCSYNRPSA